MKTKTSLSLPPDEKSMLQAIKRIHYQVYDRSRADEAIISVLLLQGNGWIINNKKEEVHPLGFMVRCQLHLGISIEANKFNTTFL